MEDTNRCVRKRDRHIRSTRKNVGRSCTAHVKRPFFLMRSWMRLRFFNYTGLYLTVQFPRYGLVTSSVEFLYQRITASTGCSHLSIGDT